MNPFELYYRKFESIPQIHQLSTIFNSKTEEVFDKLVTAYVDTPTSHSMIEPVVNRSFGNTFRHKNGPN